MRFVDGPYVSPSGERYGWRVAVSADGYPWVEAADHLVSGRFTLADLNFAAQIEAHIRRALTPWVKSYYGITYQWESE